MWTERVRRGWGVGVCSTFVAAIKVLRVGLITQTHGFILDSVGKAPSDHYMLKMLFTKPGDYSAI